MQTLGGVSSGFKLLTYSLGLFLVQENFVSHLPHQVLRVDILLLFIMGLALQLPLFLSIAWAMLVGYAADVFSGQFWGFHVCSYIFAVFLVTTILQKLELNHFFYQMLLAGCCTLFQSFLLVGFLWFTGQALFLSWSLWATLGVRLLLMMVLAPVIVHLTSGIWER
jgi:rod shape-determining protein MreD